MLMLPSTGSSHCSYSFPLAIHPCHRINRCSENRSLCMLYLSQSIRAHDLALYSGCVMAVTRVCPSKLQATLLRTSESSEAQGDFKACWDTPVGFNISKVKATPKAMPRRKKKKAVRVNHIETIFLLLRVSHCNSHDLSWITYTVM